MTGKDDGMYLIKRGPRPSYHRAPFHPVIICNKKRVAKLEAGDTGDHAWVWERHSNRMDGEGFLLARWNGFDIDYGHVVHDIGLMPDGTKCGFVHKHTGKEPWNLINGSIWWDDKEIPYEFFSAGVIYPPDYFTQQSILDKIANDGFSGFHREKPKFWPLVNKDTDVWKP